MSLSPNEKNGYLENKRAKKGVAFFGNIFFIIIPYWPFYFSKRSIYICKKNYLRKRKKYNSGPSKVDKNKRIVDLDEKVDNPGINTIDIYADKKRDDLDLGTNIANIDKKSRWPRYK